jgi:hypothetical protein
MVCSRPQIKPFKSEFESMPPLPFHRVVDILILHQFFHPATSLLTAVLQQTIPTQVSSTRARWGVSALLLFSAALASPPYPFSLRSPSLRSAQDHTRDALLDCYNALCFTVDGHSAHMPRTTIFSSRAGRLPICVSPPELDALVTRRHGKGDFVDACVWGLTKGNLEEDVVETVGGMLRSAIVESVPLRPCDHLLRMTFLGRDYSGLPLPEQLAAFNLIPNVLPPPVDAPPLTLVDSHVVLPAAKAANDKGLSVSSKHCIYGHSKFIDRHNNTKVSAPASSEPAQTASPRALTFLLCMPFPFPSSAQSTNSENVGPPVVEYRGKATIVERALSELKKGQCGVLKGMLDNSNYRVTKVGIELLWELLLRYSPSPIEVNGSGRPVMDEELTSMVDEVASKMRAAHERAFKDLMPTVRIVFELAKKCQNAEVKKYGFQILGLYFNLHSSLDCIPGVSGTELEDTLKR